MTAFNWKHYLSLAEQLVSTTNPSEAEMRSATSRAYYGAFCLCRKKKGILSTVYIPDIHTHLINIYKNSEDESEFTIGNNLYTLRKERNDADYDPFYTPTSRTTKVNIQLAENIIAMLEEID